MEVSIMFRSAIDEKGKRTISRKKVPCFGIFGVWAVTPDSKFLRWEQSRDPEKGKKPKDRWNITHMPTGYALFNPSWATIMGNRSEVIKAARRLHALANTENMPDLASDDPKVVLGIKGLGSSVKMIGMGVA